MADCAYSALGKFSMCSAYQKFNLYHSFYCAWSLPLVSPYTTHTLYMGSPNQPEPCETQSPTPLKDSYLFSNNS